MISYQNDDGSWHYSLAKKGRWIDSYHSGYVLDCLLAYQVLTKDYSYSECLSKGYEFFKHAFITNEGIPKFYNNYIYPIDCTSAAQLITTLINFGDNQIAFNIAKWMILNMQKDDGSFKFRRYKYKHQYIFYEMVQCMDVPSTNIIKKSLNEYSILPYSPCAFSFI